MPVLPNDKHELFATEVAKAVSITKAYLSAAYSGAGGVSSAYRLSKNASILARIKELKEAVPARVVTCEARRRSWRALALQRLIDGGLSLIEARKVMYADEKDGSHEFQVHSKEEELERLAEGCKVLPVYQAPVEETVRAGRRVDAYRLYKNA